MATDYYGDDESRKAAVLFGVTIIIFVLTGVYYQFIDPMASDYWNLHRIVDSGYRAKMQLAAARAKERAVAILEFGSVEAAEVVADREAAEAAADAAAEATRLLRDAFSGNPMVSPPATPATAFVSSTVL